MGTLSDSRERPLACKILFLTSVLNLILYQTLAIKRHAKELKYLFSASLVIELHASGWIQEHIPLFPERILGGCFVSGQTEWAHTLLHVSDRERREQSILSVLIFSLSALVLKNTSGCWAQPSNGNVSVQAEWALTPARFSEWKPQAKSQHLHFWIQCRAWTPFCFPWHISSSIIKFLTSTVIQRNIVPLLAASWQALHISVTLFKKKKN